MFIESVSKSVPVHFYPSYTCANPKTKPWFMKDEMLHQGRVYTTRGLWHFLRAGPQIFVFSIDYNLEIYLVLSINRSYVALHIATLKSGEKIRDKSSIY
jgi:hypothetical protein